MCQTLSVNYDANKHFLHQKNLLHFALSVWKVKKVRKKDFFKRKKTWKDKNMIYYNFELITIYYFECLQGLVSKQTQQGASPQANVQPQQVLHGATRTPQDEKVRGR